MLQNATQIALNHQQMMFALITVVFPRFYHQLTLSFTTLNMLRKTDNITRAIIRQWLRLPHDVVNAYCHLNLKDWGLSIPSLRWSEPLWRHKRLLEMENILGGSTFWKQKEIERGDRVLLWNDRVRRKMGEAVVWLSRWESITEVVGSPPTISWITVFPSGRDYINPVKRLY